MAIKTSNVEGVGSTESAHAAAMALETDGAPSLEKPKKRHMKTFYLFRIEDESGVSGVGSVAEGVQFSNGKCAMAWTTELQSITVYDSIDDVIAIHGHNGKTEVRWDGIGDKIGRLIRGETT